MDLVTQFSLQRLPAIIHSNSLLVFWIHMYSLELLYHIPFASSLFDSEMIHFSLMSLSNLSIQSIQSPCSFSICCLSFAYIVSHDRTFSKGTYSWLIICKLHNALIVRHRKEKEYGKYTIPNPSNGV